MTLQPKELLSYGVGVVGLLATLIAIISGIPWADKSELSSLQTDVRALASAHHSLEREVSGQSAQVAALTTQVSKMGDKVDRLLTRVEASSYPAKRPVTQPASFRPADEVKAPLYPPHD